MFSKETLEKYWVIIKIGFWQQEERGFILLVNPCDESESSPCMCEDAPITTAYVRPLCLSARTPNTNCQAHFPPSHPTARFSNFPSYRPEQSKNEKNFINSDPLDNGIELPELPRPPTHDPTEPTKGAATNIYPISNWQKMVLAAPSVHISGCSKACRFGCISVQWE